MGVMTGEKVRANNCEDAGHRYKGSATWGVMTGEKVQANRYKGASHRYEGSATWEK